MLQPDTGIINVSISISNRIVASILIVKIQ